MVLSEGSEGGQGGQGVVIDETCTVQRNGIQLSYYQIIPNYS